MKTLNFFRLAVCVMVIAALAACNKPSSNNDPSIPSGGDPSDPDTPNPPASEVVWTKLANCGMSMTTYASYAIGEEIYYINNNGNMWSYNIASNKWTERAKCPATAKYEESTQKERTIQERTFKFNDKIHAAIYRNRSEHTDSICRYNSIRDTWEKSDIPPYSGSYYFCVDNNLYTSYRKYISSSNTWVESPANRRAKGSIHPIIEIGGKGYEIRDAGSWVQELWVFNPKNEEWMLKLLIPYGFRTRKSVIIPSKNSLIVPVDDHKDVSSYEFYLIDITVNEYKPIKCQLPTSADFASNTVYTGIEVNGRVFVGPINASFWEVKFN